MGNSYIFARKLATVGAFMEWKFKILICGKFLRVSWKTWLFKKYILYLMIFPMNKFADHWDHLPHDVGDIIWMDLKICKK